MGYPAYPETFQAIWKLSGPSGKYPDYLDIFQTVRKLPSAISWVTRKNFLDGNATMPPMFLGLCIVTRAIITIAILPHHIHILIFTLIQHKLAIMAMLHHSNPRNPKIS